LADTQKLGLAVGKILTPPMVIALFGGLGAGKTTLIQFICQGLGVKEYVTSPSFTLINEYGGGKGRAARNLLKVYHVDLYRLENAAAVQNLGLEEYFEKDGIVLIEWAEKLGKLLPKDAESIKIEILRGQERKICLSWGLAARLKS
jgi:tRNA threonylcarbamoyladenosine biosynthesis protein TsaE